MQIQALGGELSAPLTGELSAPLNDIQLMGGTGPVGPFPPPPSLMFTIRSRKAFKSILKRDSKYGHRTPFTEMEFTEKVVIAIREGICPYCFGPLTWDNFSPDHMVPLEGGGSPDLSNIEIVCLPCNKEKSWHPNWHPHKIGKREVNV